MNASQLISVLVLVGVVAAILLAVRFAWHQASGTRKPPKVQQPPTVNRSMGPPVNPEQRTRVTIGSRDWAAGLGTSYARQAAKRAEERAAVEAAAAEKADLEKAALEQTIAEWAAAEQAEYDRIRLQHHTEQRWELDQAELRMQAVENAIAEWLEAERTGTNLAAITPSNANLNDPSPKRYTRAQAIHEQVRLLNEKVEKEVADLEFIKNRIEAGVDFLPIEFKMTVEEWKKGSVLRHNTFTDLKLKFRHKAYSIEDGYELLHLYKDWLIQQRQKLRLFIQLFGTQSDSTESIQSIIERAEQREREKSLEMDVEVIFALQDIRNILEKLIGMEMLLKQLEEVCQKRADQIIAPSWESKGTL